MKSRPVSVFPRVKGWPSRLQYVISDYSHKAFMWGYSDCAMFACDVIAALCRVDIASDIRGKYTCMADAAHVMGFPDYDLMKLVSATMEIYGFNEIHISDSSVGDLIVVQVEDHKVLGIHSGRAIAVRTLDGLEEVDLSSGVAAWCIG